MLHCVPISLHLQWRMSATHGPLALGRRALHSSYTAPFFKGSRSLFYRAHALLFGSNWASLLGAEAQLFGAIFGAAPLTFASREALLGGLVRATPISLGRTAPSSC